MRSVNVSHYVLDARTATPDFPGIGRYVANLARALVPLLEPEEKLTLLCDPRYVIELPAGVSVVVLAASPFSLQQQWAVLRLVRSLHADVYHSPYYIMPYWYTVPKLVTVHDLIPILFPKLVSWRARLLFRSLLTMAVRTSDQVIVDSGSTREDLAKILPVSEARTKVVYLGVDSKFSPQLNESMDSLRERPGLPEQFVLYLGSNKPHKNLVRLVEAWSQVGSQFPEHTLVIAGAWLSDYPESRQRAEALGLASIRWLGRVAEEDLPALYSAAEAFVFPSLYEGFGLPVLEAMACGTPVTCSQTSSLPEIAGDAAVFFDPQDTDDIIQSLVQVLASDSLQEELRIKGLHRASQFAWRRTAEATLSLYREMAGRRN